MNFTGFMDIIRNEQNVDNAIDSSVIQNFRTTEYY